MPAAPARTSNVARVRPKGVVVLVDCEAVAEGVAFVVASHCAMDTERYSAPYIPGWSADINRVRRLLERIANLSTQIIERPSANQSASRLRLRLA